MKTRFHLRNQPLFWGIRTTELRLRSMTLPEIMVVLGLMVCVVGLIGIMLPAPSGGRVMGEAVVRWWIAESSVASEMEMGSGFPVRLAVVADSGQRKLQWKKVGVFKKEGGEWVSIRNSGTLPGEWYVVPPESDASFPGSQWSGRGKGSLFSGYAVMPGPEEGMQCLWAYVEYEPDGGLESTALVCFSTRSDTADGDWIWGEPDDARCVRVLKNGTCVYPD
ncbi:MAG: hypothetical protein JW706_08985 [Opitutales bacterium]|nr:hypothetical protein [Opitutales bacterium]